MTQQLQTLIDNAWDARTDFSPKSAPADVREAVAAVLEQLNQGTLRVAQKDSGSWVVNQWVKKAVLLSFRLEDNVPMPSGQHMQFYDKVPTKFANYTEADFAKGGFRVVPPAVARRGSFIGKNVVLMPSYVNIGAYVDEGTMVDTWATVGSCAQIGKNVHLSGGVGIGGVLEPLQAAPVIIEDDAFIGSRAIVVEGVRVGKQAVLGANVVLTKSTKIIDVSGSEPVEYRGYVPERSVVIPGSIPKSFPAGEFQVPCALIIGKRKESTDIKTSLNDALREFDVAV
jgi:2,3,4,5-tetrahydropyridine-2-carboxylate N-succinyltransferase